MSGSESLLGANAQFRGKFINRLDVKKRVSIPSLYRQLLNQQPLVLRRSNRYRCIEAYPASIFAASMTQITPSTVYTDDEEDDLYNDYADTVDAIPDGEGRIILDARLLDYAGITDSVAILGKRDIFEFWEPGAAEQRIEEGRARKHARPRAERSAA